jgi:hypothetical protein
VPGRTPHQAVENYRRPIQLAISCVDARVVFRASGSIVGTEHVLALSRPARLAQTDYALDVSQNYVVIPYKTGKEKYRVSTRAYSYVIEDRAGVEVLAYQWHPKGQSHITEPHLHVHCGPLESTHLPTGRISLEDLLIYLIDEMRARPVRDNWRDVLKQTREAFKKNKSW